MKLTEAESRLGAARGWGRGDGELLSSGCKVPGINTPDE